jgi:hypothetical protein
MLPARFILYMVKIQFFDMSTNIFPTIDYLFSTAKKSRNLRFTVNIHFFSLLLKSENLRLAQFTKKATVFGKDIEVNPYIKK